MVICEAIGCKFNKENFCTKENTVIRTAANGLPVCDIMILNHNVMINNFSRQQTKNIIIEEQNKN